MKRDLDLIRDILLYLDEKPDDQPCWGEELPIQGYTPMELGYHANKLAEAGLITFEPSFTDNGRIIKCLIFSASWSGHEYLEVIRDPNIWRETKAGAQKVGGFSLEVLSAIARGLIKTKVKKHTNLDIDL